MAGPQVWGPFGWKFIHYITMGYPNNPSSEHKQNYLNFFNTLQYVLPCSICSAHFQENMKNYPLTDNILSNKIQFIEWGIYMHNLVNIKNGKKIYNIDNLNADINKDIENYNIKHPKNKETFTNSNTNSNTNSKTNTNSNTNYLLYILSVIILCFILIKIYKTYKK